MCSLSRIINSETSTRLIKSNKYWLISAGEHLVQHKEVTWSQTDWLWPLDEARPWADRQGFNGYSGVCGARDCRTRVCRILHGHVGRGRSWLYLVSPEFSFIFCFMAIQLTVLELYVLIFLIHIILYVFWNLYYV